MPKKCDESHQSEFQNAAKCQTHDQPLKGRRWSCVTHYVNPNVAKGASSVWNDNETHLMVWDCRRKLKIMNSTSFQPKRRGSVENKSEGLVNIRFLTKTSDISEISLKTSDLMLKHHKWQHW